MAKLIIKNKYGIIPDEILNSKDISLAAKGLYGYLQSKPDGWRFSISRMSLQLKEGKDAIRKAVLELEKFGLLKRTPTKDKNGKWNGYDYELLGKLAEKPLTENPTTVKPTTAKPSTDLPDNFSNTDNSNTDNSNTDNNNILAVAEATAEDIVKVINFFKEVSPFTYKDWFKNKTERKSAGDLLSRLPMNTLEILITKYLPRLNVMPYVPKNCKAFKPSELLRNLDAILTKIKELQNKRSQEKINIVI